MTSKSEIEKIFHAAVEELEQRTPLRELTSSIINIERKYIYGDATSNNRLKIIRELIEASRKKGDLC